MPVTSGQIIKQLVQLPADPVKDCWHWIGATNERGYGTKTWDGVCGPAARWVWSLFFGPLPPELCASPSCGFPNCVSPFHLRALDITAINREHKSGLLPQDVQEIRLLADNGAPHQALADRWDVDNSTITRIANRKTWRVDRKRKPQVATR